MKKRIKLSSMILVTLMAIFLLIPISVYARTPLDEIQNYEVIVDLRNDGTADIQYYLEWTVLDDTSEGALEWVKIGIANENVSEIQALTENIKKIKYYSEGAEDFVRIDFDRKYHAGETIKFAYKLHQSNLYVIDKEDHLLRYSFTPGWFPDIEVKKILIKWNKNNVIKTSAKNYDDSYYIWEGSLSFDERLNASVSYNLDAYATTEDGQAKEKSDDSESMILVVILIIIFAVVIIIGVIVIFSDDDDYTSGRGIGGSHYRSTYIHTHHSSCVSSCACVSCACACACAGGGRAGCSKKDFYGTNLKSDMLQKVLSEK